MPSISDISGLAQGTYAPAAIAVLSLIVASSFLNIKAIFARVFDSFFSTFADETSVSETQPARNQSSPKITVRFAFLAFIVLAWAPFFYSIGNLSPLNITYTSPASYLEADSHSLGEIACSKKPALDLYATVRLVEASAAYADEATASAVRGQVSRAFGVLSVTKSCFVLFMLCGVLAAVKKDLRQASAHMILLSVALIAYLAMSSYSSVKNAITNEAFSKIALTSAKMTDAERANIKHECVGAFDEKARTTLTLAVAPSLEWPSLTSLLPLQNDSAK